MGVHVYMSITYVHTHIVCQLYLNKAVKSMMCRGRSLQAYKQLICAALVGGIKKQGSAMFI